MATTATCSTCGNLYDPDNVRETHPYRHPVDGPLPKSSNQAQGQGEPKSGKATVAELPTDPVLRATLIRIGVLKTTDLIQTEQELAATGMVAADDREYETITNGVGEIIGRIDRPAYGADSGWQPRTADE